MSDNNTVLGIDQNLEALLCYVLGWVTGIVFLFLEKENEYVRFHAMQSLVTFLALFIITLVIGWIPILGWLISFLFSILGLVLWLILMIKAYKGESYKLPYVGDFSEEQLSKM
ncbi:MAG: DUF4870 domain-containing protein [Bacillota bacterium]